ncbi:GNAT family N-acetyltransferase [Yinghuangia soli]|uniref:GNAT family N-acetyltransferase n=1 Tax=Yinghuangia soli TaxID=2908204 RepID=A0AA41PTS0_9ACTN|nr:GNAT family N-acetyltransferase [Yinghuangia soli]MCF2525728.1 GNAT family N-acetyltransferase [Yinghuangia soli]
MNDRISAAGSAETTDDIPALVRAWVEGWVVSRAAAPPVVEPWGFTVEVGLAKQVRRHVLPFADEAVLRKLVETAAPHTWLKVFAAEDDLRALLAPGWRFDDAGYLMSIPLTPAEVRVPDGYRVASWTHGGLTKVVVTTTGDGELAARGQIGVPAPGAPAVADQIETVPGHQRRGLGSVVMRSLQNAACESGSRLAVLGATDDGQALYGHLGWTTHAPLTGILFDGA